MLKLKPNVRNAVLLGCMCSISYLAVYFARNTLGTVTPQMLESGAFTTGQIGTLSSVYFITYAVGQLINGVLGDKIKAKYMISFGLVLAGLCQLMLIFFSSPMVGYVAYGMTGFFLSMVYGPMVKVMAENVDPLYVTRCNLGYTFASLLGSPMAGVFAMFLAWQGVFISSSAFLLLCGVVCFGAFLVLEHKKIVQYNRVQKNEDKRSGGIRLLLSRGIVKFTLISILTGVIRTSVVFWMPTYLSQQLGFSAKTAALIFTISTLIISETAFVAVFLYERLKYNMNLTILVTFVASAICFAGVYLFSHPVVNIAFLILGIMASGCAASIIWCCYCPSLRDTGMVSTATGFLDFVSYIAAAAASSVFANAVTAIGWSGLVLVWFGLMALGVVVSLPYKKKVPVH
ncbi:MAG: MFS transporter [Clostridia bacterium]|nr:MFS transporter [Clostridia bacterium]